MLFPRRGREIVTVSWRGSLLDSDRFELHGGIALIVIGVELSRKTKSIFGT